MAKLSYTKLGLKVNQENGVIFHNDQTIEVKFYLPVNDKLKLISNVINLSADDNNFANPVKQDVYFALEVIENYTNINFTNKQKEDPTKLYDSFISTGLYNKIVDVIPEDEIMRLKTGLQASVKAVYDYRNSVMGILDTISTDYSNLDLDASNIHKKIADPENMALLKDVLTKLG